MEAADELVGPGAEVEDAVAVPDVGPGELVVGAGVRLGSSLRVEDGVGSGVNVRAGTTTTRGGGGGRTSR